MTTIVNNADDFSTLKFVTFIGDGYVGKSSILTAIEGVTEKRKLSIQQQTSASLQEEITVNLDFRRTNIKFVLLDTAGQEEYDQIRRATYDKTSIFLLCFSVADKTSFENIQSRWMQEIQPYRHIPIILVGTKRDLAPHSIPYNRGQKLRKKIGARHYVECSALNGDGIDKVIEYCAQILITPREKKKFPCSVQ